LGNLETEVHDVLCAKARSLGAQIYALNGVEDHIHMVVGIPPKIAVATFVGQVKAFSSTRINKSGLIAHPFRWQAEYGAFSFDRKRLPRIIAYVANQKEHHQQGTLIQVLETTSV
jgi:REP element-mobilizing transposase RayT